MSCLGNDYNPQPPRVWSRFETVCNNDDPDNMKQKADVLQYKVNSSNLTKKQRYSQIAQSKWCERKTTWATQTQTYTNPNTGIPPTCSKKIWCFPTSNSGVPGKNMFLCSTRHIQTYYPRRKLTMSSNGNQFPEGYKFN
jgi:hypothetical protein